MQSYLSRWSGGVFGTVGNLFTPTKSESINNNNNNNNTSDRGPIEHSRNNIEYVDEVSNNLYPDLHYSEIIGTHKPQDDDDFLLLETTEVPQPMCPYYYIPFSQNVDMCNTLIRNWLQTIWFLPSDWKASLKILPGRPCLVPFFIFDSKTTSLVEAEIQVDDENGLKKWKHISDQVNSEYGEIIACASRSINQKLIHKLLYCEGHGFSFHSHLALPTQLSPYPPQSEDITVVPEENILSIDITKEEAWAQSVGNIEEEEKEKGRIKTTHQPYDVHAMRGLKVETEYEINHFVLYLPIYFSSFEYSGQVYEVLVSGNKGVVVGSSLRERPIGTGSGGKFIMDKLKSLSNLVTDTVPM